MEDVPEKLHQEFEQALSRAAGISVEWIESFRAGPSYSHGLVALAWRSFLKRKAADLPIPQGEVTLPNQRLREGLDLGIEVVDVDHKNYGGIRIRA